MNKNDLSINNVKISPKINNYFYFFNEIKGISDGIFIKNKKSNSKENNSIIDPLAKIIFNYNDIQEIIQKKDSNTIKLLYFNRVAIHDILVKEDKIIDIEFLEISKNLSSYFYLCLLIEENLHIVDYAYSINLIKQINDIQNNIKNNEKYKKILFSHIIIQLINNYNDNDNINQSEEEAKLLNVIEKSNIEIIKNNLNAFKELDLKMNTDDIIAKRIDKIYIELLIGLLRKKKLEYTDYIINLNNELDLSNINLTKTMLHELFKFLSNEKILMNDYLIEKENDISNSQKLNFYNVLLNYILKNSIYIYQNSNLMKIRKNILKIIKSNALNWQIKDTIKNKIELFLDSEYYFHKYFHNNNQALKGNHINFSGSMNPFSASSFINKESSKGDSMLNKIFTNTTKKEISLIKTLYNKQIASKLLNQKIILEVNSEGKTNYICKININHNTILEYNDLKNLKIDINDENLKKSYNKFLTILSDIEKYFQKNSKKSFPFKIILDFKIENNGEKGMINNNSLYNLSVVYNLHVGQNTSSFKDDDILSCEDIEKADGFLFLIQEISEI